MNTKGRKMADEELEVKGPGGVGLSFRGSQMFPVILVLLLAAFFGYFSWQVDARSEARDTRTSETIAQTTTALKEFRDTAVKAQETQEAMIYVQYVCSRIQSKQECENLNLSKPRGLRELQR